MRTIAAGPFGKEAEHKLKQEFYTSRMDGKIINDGFNDNTFTSTISQI